jgi:short-subunit dehydrogenase
VCIGVHRWFLVSGSVFFAAYSMRFAVPRRKRLDDCVIIITGASSGIGAATAIECARAGMDVVLNARRADRLEAVSERVRELGRRAVTVAGCVTEHDLPRRLLDAAEGEFGRFDAVFANAGYTCSHTMLETSPQELRAMFDVNFFASVELLREAAHRMIAENRPGHLLMCASCLAKFSLPLHGHYSATKAAQNQVCWSMRAELAPHGIEVSSVLPVTTSTELFEVSARRSGREPGRAMIPDHAPKLFVQPPERVGRAIVRCLRKPKPEVWMSHTVRYVAAAMTAFPWFAEWIMRREMRREMRRTR